MINIVHPTFEIESSLGEKYKFIAGVDEVGRGALAGPIVAGAVIFGNFSTAANKLVGINDSKKMTAKKRLEFDELIKKITPNYGIGIVDCSEIDQIGIGAANILAFKRALDQLKRCDYVLIDGRAFHGLDRQYQCFEKGDSKSISIAAASIIAKVYRDALMQDIHEEIFRYDFASNKGYGSRAHLEALAQFGPCKHHRKTFLKNIQKKSDQSRLF